MYRASPICVAAHRVQSLAHSCVHVGKAWMPDSCVLHQSIDKLEKTVNKGLKKGMTHFIVSLKYS